MTSQAVYRIDAGGRDLAVGDVARTLAEGEAVHRELRADLPGDYLGYMQRMFDDGARLTQIFDDGGVRGIAVWRTYLTTYAGRRFELDDLVTAEAARSKGYGATMLAHLERQARALKCQSFMLVSAVHRRDAHRFYFRERFAIDAFLFSKRLT
jgi:GNAT superfamily N-acetyltransferase